MSHVLHLEDDVFLREIFKVAFEAAEPNIKLTQFVNSDDTISYIQEHHATIDLFVLDIRVPGELSGVQVAEKIRTLNSTAPIVVTSAFGKPAGDTLTAINCEWIPKPWYVIPTVERLLKTISNKPTPKAPIVEPPPAPPVAIKPPPAPPKPQAPVWTPTSNVARPPETAPTLPPPLAPTTPLPTTAILTPPSDLSPKTTPPPPSTPILASSEPPTPPESKPPQPPTT